MKQPIFFPYLYLLPAGIILGLFSLGPLLGLFYSALFDWGIRQGKFNGLNNFRELVVSQDFWNAFLVTGWFVILTIPVSLLMSFVLAYFLSQKIAGRAFLRSCYFFPFITSTVASAAVWSWFYHPQIGLANAVLRFLGIFPQKWLLEPAGIFQLLMNPFNLDLPVFLQGPSLALISVSFYSIWHSLGFDIVILLAALTQIPKEPLESAKIDGAGHFSLMFKMVLPLCWPSFYFLILVGSIRTFQTFNQIYIMTGGGPLHKTETITMLVFRNFYEYTKVGYASAIAIVLFLLVLGVTILQKVYYEKVYS